MLDDQFEERAGGLEYRVEELSAELQEFKKERAEKVALVSEAIPPVRPDAELGLRRYRAMRKTWDCRCGGDTGHEQGQVFMAASRERSLLS